MTEAVSTPFQNGTKVKVFGLGDGKEYNGKIKGLARTVDGNALTYIVEARLPGSIYSCVLLPAENIRLYVPKTGK